MKRLTLHQIENLQIGDILLWKSGEHTAYTVIIEVDDTSHVQWTAYGRNLFGMLSPNYCEEFYFDEVYDWQDKEWDDKEEDSWRLLGKI